MAYKGQSYVIDAGRGGLTGNNNLDTIPPFMMVHPSRNINLHNGGREKRGGTSIVRHHETSNDFTAFTEVDTAGNRIQNITATSFDLVDVPYNENVRLYKDFGADYFTGNFIHYLKINILADTAGAAYIWGVSQVTTDLYNTGPNLALSAGYGGEGGLNFYLDQITGGGGYIFPATTPDLAYGTDYWLTISRDTSEGSYGVLSVDVYSDANRTQLVKSYDYTLYGNDNYRYLHAAGSKFTGGVTVFNGGTISSLQVNSRRILGMYDFRLLAGTQYLIAATNDGSVYKSATETIATGMSTTNHYNFETGEDKLFICDGATIPKVWTGSGNAAAITSPPTDWTTTKPFQLIRHGPKNSERMWGINKNGVYASLDNDFEDFSDGTVIYIPIDTGDGYGLVGAVEFGDRLIVFGKRRAWIIDDTSTDPTDWGYNPVQWEGGVSHFNLIIKTPNDILCMMDDGEIYSVTTAQSYGDYKQASLTRPAFMHTWIKAHADLDEIADFHAAYDPVLRAVKIFVRRVGQTQVDTALVYYIDRPAAEAWMVHDNQSADSGYSASACCQYRKTVGETKIYTGDYIGNAWELETANRNDNGSAFYGGFKMPVTPLEQPRANKLFNGLTVVATAQGSYNLSYEWWVDGTSQGTGQVSLAGVGASLDSFALDTDALGAGELIDSSAGLGEVGRRIQTEMYNSTANQTFFVSEFLLDFKPLGAKQGG